MLRSRVHEGRGAMEFFGGEVGWGVGEILFSAECTIVMAMCAVVC